MNEQNEINGDLRDEYLTIQAAERDEANRDAPEPKPLTPAELDDWYQQWSIENAPDLIPDGETEDGTPIWILDPTPEERYLAERYPYVRDICLNTGPKPGPFSIRHR